MVKENFLQFFEIESLTGEALDNSIVNGNIKLICLMLMFVIFVINYIILTADTNFGKLKYKFYFKFK